MEFLKGKVVLVIGGGFGIGEYMVILFVWNGVIVVILDINEEYGWKVF